MEKFTHIALQTDKTIDQIEEALRPLGVNSFMKFDKKKPGLYIMSMTPIGSSELTNENLMDEMADAMQEFINRCDKGEVRSTYTYNKFKEILYRSKSHGN